MDAPVGNGSSDNAGANPMTAVPVAVASVRGNPIEPFFDSLSRELVVEILLRLPIKSVHCCRCVSKYWFSLISDPYFAHQYMHRQPKSLRAMSTLLVQEVPHRRAKDLTVYSTSKEQIFKFQGFSFSFLQEQSPTDSVYIIASCNDLVLCSDGFSKQSHYYICNPLTMQCVALPGPHPSRSQWNLTKLICDYCDDQGFTSTITRCNVVRIQQCRTFCHDNGSSTAGFYVENFSCETRQWSELSLWSPLGSRWIPSSVVVCNGMLYWLSHEQEIINGIVAFDPYNNSNGQCHFIDLPEDTNFYFESTFLGVWQGHLRVSHMLRHYCDLRVWELKDFFTGEWCLEHKVHLNQKVNKLYFDPSDGDVVYFSKDGEMFSFDMKSKKQKKVFSHANRSISINAIPFLLLWPPTPVPMLQPKAIQR